MLELAPKVRLLALALAACALLLLAPGARAEERADGYADFTDRLGCPGGRLAELFTFEGVAAAYINAQPSFTTGPGDGGLPPVTGSWDGGDRNKGVYVRTGAYAESYVDKRFNGTYLEPYSPVAGSSYTLTLRLPAAQRLQFSVADLDDPYGYDVTGFDGTEQVRPQAYGHGGIAGPTLGTSGQYATLRAASSSLSDFDQRAVADIAFQQPVDRIEIKVVSDASAGSGSNTILRPYGCAPSGDVEAASAVHAENAGPAPTAFGEGARHRVTVTVKVDNDAPAGTTPLTPRLVDDLRARISGGGVSGRVESVSVGEVLGPKPACTPNPAWLDGTSERLLDGAGVVRSGESCRITYTAEVSTPGLVPYRPWSKPHGFTLFADAAGTRPVDSSPAAPGLITFDPPAGLLTRPAPRNS